MKSIFVSSTFKDMHSERDILQLEVVPALNSYIRKFGDELRFVDLRWGVNTQDLDSAEGSKKVLDVCINEIDNCKPYMIILLGERYGWVPPVELLENSVKDRDFELDSALKSVTALEIEYGALSKNAIAENCYFYFREALPYDKMSDEDRAIYESENPEYYEKLNALKENIKERFGDRVFFYSGVWDEQERKLTNLEAFKERIIRDITGLIDREYKDVKQLSWQEKEQRAIKLFIDGKCAQFSSREQLILDYQVQIANPTNKLVVINGEAGSGKSSIMSMLTSSLMNEGKNVFPFICGNSAKSSNIQSFLHQVIYYLEDLLKIEHYESKSEDDISFLSTKLTELANNYQYQYDEDLTIIIDALDQLTQTEDVENYTWLPADLPSKVTVVVSHLPEYKYNIPYEYKFTSKTLLIPDLKDEEKIEIINGIMGVASKEIDGETIKAIIAKKNSTNPFYLQLLIKRLLMFDSSDYSEIANRGNDMEAISQYMQNVISVCSDDLNELSAQVMLFGSEKINKEQCDFMLSLIANSRYGVRASDLESIFSQEKLIWSNLDLSRFTNYMAQFFSIREDGKINFTHKSLRAGLNKHTNFPKINSVFLNHYLTLPDDDIVKTQELFYYAFLCGDTDEVRKYIISISTAKDVKLNFAAYGELINILEQGGVDWLFTLISKELAESANIYFFMEITFLLALYFTPAMYVEISSKILDLLKEHMESLDENIRDERITKYYYYLACTNMCEHQNNLSEACEYKIKAVKLTEDFVENSVSTLYDEYDSVLYYLTTKDARYEEYCYKLFNLCEKEIENTEEIQAWENYTNSLNRLAEYYIILKDYPKAEEFALKANKILKERFSGAQAQSSSFSFSFNAKLLFNIYYNLGAYATMLEQAQDYIYYAEKNNGESRSIISLSYLANAYRECYKSISYAYSSADVAYLTKAEDIYILLAEKNKTMSAYLDLYNIYDDILYKFISDKNAKYLEYYKKKSEVLNILKTYENADLSWYVTDLELTKADIDIEMKNYDEAIICYSKFKSIYEENLLKDRNVENITATADMSYKIYSLKKMHDLNQDGSVYFDEAISLYEELLEKSKSSELYVKLAELYLDYARLHFDTEYLDKSIALYEKYTSEKNTVANNSILCLNYQIVGECYWQFTGNISYIYEYKEKALKFIEEIYNSFAPDSCPTKYKEIYLNCLDSIAQTYFSNENYLKADEYYKKADTITDFSDYYNMSFDLQLKILSITITQYGIAKKLEKNTYIGLEKIDVLIGNLMSMYAEKEHRKKLERIYFVCAEHLNNCGEDELASEFGAHRLSLLKELYEETKNLEDAQALFEVCILNGFNKDLGNLECAQKLIPILKNTHAGSETQLQMSVDHAYTSYYFQTENYDEVILIGNKYSELIYTIEQGYYRICIMDIYSYLLSAYYALGDKATSEMLMERAIKFITGDQNFSIKKRTIPNFDDVHESFVLSLGSLLLNGTVISLNNNEIERAFYFWKIYYNFVKSKKTVYDIFKVITSDLASIINVTTEKNDKNMAVKIATEGLSSCDELLEKLDINTEASLYAQLLQFALFYLVTIEENYKKSIFNKRNFDEEKLAYFEKLQMAEEIVEAVKIEEEKIKELEQYKELLELLEKYSPEIMEATETFYIPPKEEELARYNIPEFDSDYPEGSVALFKEYKENLDTLYSQDKSIIFDYMEISFILGKRLLHNNQGRESSSMFASTKALADILDSGEGCDILHYHAFIAYYFYPALEMLRANVTVSFISQCEGTLEMIELCKEDHDDYKFDSMKADVYYLMSLYHKFINKNEERIENLLEAVKTYEVILDRYYSHFSMRQCLHIMCEIVDIYLEMGMVEEAVEYAQKTLDLANSYYDEYLTEEKEIDVGNVHFADDIITKIIKSFDFILSAAEFRYGVVQSLYELRNNWVQQDYTFDLVTAAIYWGDCLEKIEEDATALESYKSAADTAYVYIESEIDDKYHYLLHSAYLHIIRLCKKLGHTSQLTEYNAKLAQAEKNIKLIEYKKTNQGSKINFN